MLAVKTVHWGRWIRRGIILAAMAAATGLHAVPDDTQARLEKLRENPLFQQLLDQSRPGLTDTQKKLLLKAIDSLSEQEIDDSLQELHLSTDGSATTRKDRLKIAVGLMSAPELPKTKQGGAIGIENAAEGEFMRGENDGEGLMVLRGRIRLRLPSGIVLADTVIVDTKRQELFAEGNLVYYKTGEKDGKTGEIHAERLLYDQKLGTGILYNADGYMAPVYFMGKSIQQISQGKISVSHVYFTTCSAQRPHYNFTASRVWLSDDREIIAVGALYYVGGIPLLPIPFLYASPWGTGIITQMGHGDIQGYYMQNTYQFSVPEAYTYDFLPVGYRFKADFYQNTGNAFGIDLFRFSPGLNYYLEAGAAEFHRYEVIGDFRDKKEIRFTNAVTRSDGTQGKDYYNWYKIFTILNYRKTDFRNNQVRSVQLRYEDYSHRLYEFEFGGRYQPTSTIPALYQKGEADRGLIRNDTNWSLVYSEAFDDLSVRVQASRSRVWLESSNYKDSKYVPVSDVVPSLDVQKKWQVGKLPLLDSPIIWENKIHTDLTKLYSSGDVYQTTNFNQFTSGLRTWVSPFSFVTFQPFVGYGAQKTVPYSPTKTTYTTTGPTTSFGVTTTDFKALERESARQSYQFLYTEDELTLGPDLIFLRTTYRRKESFKEEEKEAPAVNVYGFDQKQKVHEVEGSLEAYPINRLALSITSIYDMRRFQFDVKQNQRWYYPVARVDYYFDFINLFREERENLLTRRKAHFLGLRLTNDYVYDALNKRDHSDVVGVNFEAGGFDLLVLRRLRYLEAGFYWYHVYYNPGLDHMRYSMKADIQVVRWLFWEMELESRATEVERYRKDSKDANGYYNYVSFTQDVVNSTGLAGRRRRQNAVFNIGTFE
ncbi:MAG TPA: hypothetical protein PKK45_20290, partial [Leptospiraceae bacterium]|nr:hypothetical protein [Leptospiraceae bacterium]